MSPSCLSCSAPLRANFHWAELFSLNLFQNNLFPPLHDWLCPNCQKEIQLLEGETCSLCSRSIDELAERYLFDYRDDRICYDCQRWLDWAEDLGYELILSGNVSAMEYNSLAEQLIRRYKFQGDRRLSYFFTSLFIHMPTATERLSKIDLVSCIPLSEKRLKERGFNQADLIAGQFANFFGIPYQEDLLIRLADSDQKQSKKKRTERLADLLQKFIKNTRHSVDITNKQILLIDDIYTTGATLHAAAYTLLEAGAQAIYSLTVAR